MINWNVYAYSEVKSTNLLAEELFERLDPLAAIIADSQTEGKGHGTNTWDSPLGGLWVTLVLKTKECQPIICPRPLISLAAGLAVCDTLSSFEAKNLKIKWPNDIVHTTPKGFNKLGGVLTTVKYLGNELEGIIIGVGINLSSDSKYSESTPNYYCLDQQDIIKTPEEVLDILLIQITNRLWRSVKEDLIQDINSLLYKKGQEILWKEGQHQEKVEIMSVNEQGYLKIKKNKEIMTLSEEERHFLEFE